MANTAHSSTAGHGAEGTRRDFLYLTAGAFGAVGAGATLWPFIHQMNPSADVLALSTIEVDIAAVQPGQSIKAMWRGKPLRPINVSDDSDMRMGDYMDWAADAWQLPRPPRITWQEAQTQLPAMTLSFMRESRRLHNRRLKEELRLRLRYPTVKEGLRGKPVG